MVQYTIEYYSAIKKNKMSFAVKQMELENTKLSEISQTPKDNTASYFSYVKTKIK